MNDALLLTGATGFVGMELLARYLERTDRTVYAPVRAGSDEEAEERLRETLSALFDAGGDGDARRIESYARRLVAVPADLTSPGLGMEPARREEIAERVGEVLHCAASVSFTLGLSEQRAINVKGTERVLELASLCAGHGGLKRFSYISTAYVAGNHRGTFGEDDLDVGQRFRNAYERSKFEAEQLVRAHSDRFPVAVFRPSVVVGERRSGWTSSFNVIYWPLRAFMLGTYAAVPARRSAPVDVVPVDYVADAVFALSQQPDGTGETQTHHLTAGAEATSVGTLLDLSARRLGRPPPRVVPPSLYRTLIHPLLLLRAKGPRREALRASEAYFPYFDVRVTFEDRRTRRALEQSGVRFERLERYFDRVVDFALSTRFGRRGMGRAEARARTGDGPAG